MIHFKIDVLKLKKFLLYKRMFFSFFTLTAYYLLFSIGLNLNVITLSAGSKTLTLKFGKCEEVR
ncbi:hypothetical protein COE30_13950 [Bacillus cereus]|nr:hypothetical protein COE30_13950 [Bacillus cereus]